jgi:ADP-heptose:LPS heptosyltransferase
MPPRKLILRSFLSPGDIVTLTAAVRALHVQHPGRFLTDVRTSCSELWQHNPYLTPLSENDAEVENIDCHYPLVDSSNTVPLHMLHGFTEFLSQRLKVNLRPAEFRGDIHLGPDEMRWKSAVHELAGRDLPFWIINAGGKFDYTIKWWSPQRYQQVVDHFLGRVLFVQIGELGHYHPPLRNVVDLRGRTTLRELVRLVYHSQGVLCGVTGLMHLAAAVPRRSDRPAARAGVIIGGGREPVHWEAYPGHQFLHTIGALRCCADGGCWRARTRVLGDGEPHDNPASLCHDVVNDLPHCMDLITAEDVIRRIENYFDGGACRYLTRGERTAAERAVRLSESRPRMDATVNLLGAPGALKRFASEARRTAAPAARGTGVLLVAASNEEVASCRGLAARVRACDAEVPIELAMWVRLSVEARSVFSSLQISLRKLSPGQGEVLPSNAERLCEALHTTELRRVLVLTSKTCDADVRRALRLLQESDSAVFVKGDRTRARPGVWRLCGFEQPSFALDTSWFIIDRLHHWSALLVWRWILERNYFFGSYLDGDGGALQLSWAASNQSMTVLPRAVVRPEMTAHA